jgi:hypothetical protein
MTWGPWIAWTAGIYACWVVGGAVVVSAAAVVVAVLDDTTRPGLDYAGVIAAFDNRPPLPDVVPGAPDWRTGDRQELDRG